MLPDNTGDKQTDAPEACHEQQRRQTHGPDARGEIGLDGCIRGEEGLRQRLETYQHQRPKCIIHKDKCGNSQESATNEPVGQCLRQSRPAPTMLMEAVARIGRNSLPPHDLGSCARMSSALHARIGRAYDRACSAPESNEPEPAEAGGFFPEAGGFIPEEAVVPTHAPVLLLHQLSNALAPFHLDAVTRDEVESLLRQSAESSEDGTTIRRDDFIEVLEIVLGEQEERDSEASDAYDPAADDDDDSVYETDEANTRQAQNRMPKRKDLHEKARFLYRLLLERIPLVPSSALATYDKNRNAPTEVDDRQLETRRIGLEELRYAAQSLGERTTTHEVRVMLTCSLQKCSRKRAHTSGPILGKNDPRTRALGYRSALHGLIYRFTYMTYKTGMLDTI